VATFIGTYHSKVDRKGRVSVPVLFRNALTRDSFQGIVAFPSHRSAALEACGFDFMQELETSMFSALDLYSEEQDDIAATMFGDSRMLPFDGDGRVILPQDLAEHAGITDRAAFIGKGPIFQVWNPDDLDAHKTMARARMRERGLTLPLRPGGGGR